MRWDPKGDKLTDLFNAILHNGKVQKCPKSSLSHIDP